MYERYCVVPSDHVTVHKSPTGALRVTIGKELSVLDAVIMRCYPQSRPDEWISIRDGDGKEVCLMETMRKMNQESRHLIEVYLEERYFVPMIEQLKSVSVSSGILALDVVTDRGVETIFVKDFAQNIRWLSVYHIVITDIEGNRYDIPDKRKLDPKMLLKLERAL